MVSYNKILSGNQQACLATYKTRLENDLLLCVYVCKWTQGDACHCSFLVILELNRWKLDSNANLDETNLNRGLGI